MPAYILFWLSAFLLFHSYLLYPAILKAVTFRKKPNGVRYPPGDAPPVTILMAVYNEEAVIAQKIDSIFESGYPHEKIQLVIGSDCCTDRTNELIRERASKYGNVELVEFDRRTGKVMIINTLVERAAHDVLLLTDANVIFGKNVIYELVKHFRNERIGLVDSNMQSKGMRRAGISVQEKTYIRAEVFIKHMEGLWGGCMIGPFGGCYAIRKKYFSKVPSNFLVDDFYISMRVLERGAGCINDLDALVYEDVSHSVREEFRRKVRIATGNFQNLGAFARLLIRPGAIAFCFLSHKAIRWAGPILLLTALVSNLFLIDVPLFRAILVLQLAFYVTPALDGLLHRLGIHVALFRFTTHLLSMNLALLLGMTRYLKGVESSVWQPTRRNQ